MKIERIDRAVIALYAVMGALAMLIVIIWACFPESAAGMGRSFEMTMTGAPALRIGLVVLMVALLALSGFIIWLMVFGKRKIAEGSLALQDSESGAVRVSMAALETLARQAIGQADGIEKLTVTLSEGGDALSVAIGLTVYADTSIPAVTQTMQANVRRVIEEFAGVAVRDVTVLVSGIAQRPSGSDKAGRAEKTENG